MTAESFIEALTLLREDANIPGIEKVFRENDPELKALGVRHGELFKTAKTFTAMPIREVARLLDNNYYEIRMGGVCIMDFKARNNKLSEEDRKSLFNLYLEKHHRINNWGYVDRAAPSVIGKYLLDKPRDILYKLAVSSDPWERRTAIVSTWAFIRMGELDDTFKIAAILVNDPHPNIHKAVGSWIREAGKKDRERLVNFLEKYATEMSRTTLRYAIEKFDQEERKYFLGKR